MRFKWKQCFIDIWQEVKRRRRVPKLMYISISDSIFIMWGICSPAPHINMKKIIFTPSAHSANVLWLKHLPVHGEIAITEGTWMDSQWARRKGPFLHVNWSGSPTPSKGSRIRASWKRLFAPPIFPAAPCVCDRIWIFSLVLFCFVDRTVEVQIQLALLTSVFKSV